MFDEALSAAVAYIGFQLIDQSGQFLGVHGLLQMTKGGQAMRLEESFNAFENPTVLTAYQNYAAAVLVLHQASNELDAVHSGHVDVQQDQIDDVAASYYMLQSLFSAVVRRCA